MWTSITGTSCTARSTASGSSARDRGLCGSLQCNEVVNEGEGAREDEDDEPGKGRGRREEEEAEEDPNSVGDLGGTSPHHLSPVGME